MIDKIVRKNEWIKNKMIESIIKMEVYSNIVYGGTE